MFFIAYSVPNPDFERLHTRGSDGLFTEANKYARSIEIDTRPECRHDPDLIEVVRELGDRAAGHCAELRIVEIPDGVDYQIEEYDGNEHIAEVHRTWR